MRNPRRAYTADGAEIPPMTLGAMRGLGVQSIQAWCECRHGAIGIGIEAVSDDVPVPDLALRLRCSVRDSKAVKTRPDWTEYRAAGMRPLGPNRRADAAGADSPG
jgi:hypothetical protein